MNNWGGATEPSFRGGTRDLLFARTHPRPPTLQFNLWLKNPDKNRSSAKLETSSLYPHVQRVQFNSQMSITNPSHELLSHITSQLPSYFKDRSPSPGRKVTRFPLLWPLLPLEHILLYHPYRGLVLSPLANSSLGMHFNELLLYSLNYKSLLSWWKGTQASQPLLVTNLYKHTCIIKLGTPGERWTNAESVKSVLRNSL